MQTPRGLEENIVRLFGALTPPVLAGDSRRSLRDTGGSDSRGGSIGTTENLELVAISPSTGDMVALGANNWLYVATATELRQITRANASHAATAAEPATSGTQPSGNTQQAPMLSPPPPPPLVDVPAVPTFRRLRLTDAAGDSIRLPRDARLAAVGSASNSLRRRPLRVWSSRGR